MSLRKYRPWWPCAVLAWVLSCASPAPEERHPSLPRDAGPFLAQLRSSLGNDADVVPDHFVARRIGDTVTVLLMASTPKQRSLAIFEQAGEASSIPTPDARGGYRCVFATAFERHDAHWMNPEPPRWSDLDGDGLDELLLEFRVLLADRSASTLLLLARRAGAWRLLPHPGLLASLRPHLESAGIRASVHQEDKLAQLQVAGHRTWLQGLAQGGGWHLVVRPDGSGPRLLGVAVMSEGKSSPGQDRIALAMFRLVEDGFVLDPTWNDGRPYLTPSPARVGELDLEAMTISRFAAMSR